jgi:hypothetical protein
MMALQGELQALAERQVRTFALVAAFHSLAGQPTAPDTRSDRGPPRRPPLSLLTDRTPAGPPSAPASNRPNPGRGRQAA